MAEYYAYNAVGSVVANTDQQGFVIRENDFDAYGNVVREQDWESDNFPAIFGGSQNDLLFSTKERDFSTGLDYFGFRYYDAVLGKFLNRDPSGYPDGPNNYLYCNNNPINCIDPLGLRGVVPVLPPVQVAPPSTGVRQNRNVGTTTGVDQAQNLYLYMFGANPEQSPGMQSSGRVENNELVYEYSPTSGDLGIEQKTSMNPSFNNKEDFLEYQKEKKANSPSERWKSVPQKIREEVQKRMLEGAPIETMLYEAQKIQFKAQMEANESRTAGPQLDTLADGGKVFNDSIIAPSGQSERSNILEEDSRHGNTAGDQDATLYKKYDSEDKFLKHGLSQDPKKRYSKKELDGGYLIEGETGPRNEMLKKERNFVETDPGEDNNEPWAGKRKNK